MAQNQTGMTMGLSGINDLTINEAALRAHVMRPPNVVGIISRKGPPEARPPAALEFPKAAEYRFDKEGFCDGLHAALKDSVAGYVMELRQNGEPIATRPWNWAKTAADGEESWTPEVRMHVASCSKLITGIAMTKLLNDKEISYNRPIVDYLPKYWEKGAGVEKITFRELMTHTSGFNFDMECYRSDYEFMRHQVAAGVAVRGQFWYQNMNFGLCRILIATINDNVSVGAKFNPGYVTNDEVWDHATIQAYAKYVREQVFEPAGVSGSSLAHDSPDALAYRFPASGNGWNSGDLSTMSGGAGWHLSVKELLDVMGTFRRKGTIMSATHAQNTLDHGFCVDKDVQRPTALGTLYNKDGLWRDDDGHLEQSLAYFLPQDMELVVLANSPVGSADQFFRDLITDIYVENIKAS